MIRARLAKLSTLPNATLDPNGAATGGVIQDGYEVLGYYAHPPTIGEPFVISRYERNGVRAEGIMTTSPVIMIGIATEMNGIIFHTQNSIYHLIPLS